MARRTRRFWSEDEKRRIVAQSYAPGVSVSVVASLRRERQPDLHVAPRPPLQAGGRRRCRPFLPAGRGRARAVVAVRAGWIIGWSDRDRAVERPPGERDRFVRRGRAVPGCPGFGRMIPVPSSTRVCVNGVDRVSRAPTCEATARRSPRMPCARPAGWCVPASTAGNCIAQRGRADLRCGLDGSQGGVPAPRRER